MHFFRFRLNEVNTILVDCGLIPESTTFEINERAHPDEAIEFFRNTKSRHEMRVTGFPDGEISVALIALDELSRPTTILSLITTEDGKAWTIRLIGDSDFVQECSELQGQLWFEFPPRIDNEEGIFGERSGRIALAKIAASFAALEP